MAEHATGPQAALVRFSIRFRGVVIALACVLLGYGIYALRETKYDVFPEFARPQVAIQTEAPGLSPEQVEALVTQPLENSVNGVPGLRTLQSNSIQGLSVIKVSFDPASDIYLDRQQVAERLAAAAAQLPSGVKSPLLTPLTSSTSTVLVIGLTSRSRSLMELRTAATWTVRPRLLAVPGVAKVTVYGGEQRSIQIQVRPDRLIRFGIGLNEVLTAARRATGVRGAGFIDTANQRIVLRSEGQSLTPEEVGRTVVVNRGGASVRLADLAYVVQAPEPAVGGATVEGRTGVILDISEQYGTNTLEVTQGVDAALADLHPSLERTGIELHENLFRPATFITTATGNVRASLLLGGALVVVVLFLFLFDLRTAAISCAAIPLSLLAAVIALGHFGVTLNTMTLGGLAISIGVVVDDAVVGIENIVRRLRENRALAAPRPMARVVLDACLEVRGAVAYATFAVILVVLPVLALSGIAGRFFAPLGTAYVLAVLASLVVALTVTPALAMLAFAGGHLKQQVPPVMRWSRARYERLLARLARHPGAVVATALALTLAAAAAVPFLRGRFIPQLKEGHYIVHMTAVPGTSIGESLRLGKLVSRALLALPEVSSVAQRAGRAELSGDTHGTHQSEFEVDLKPGAQAGHAEAAIRRALVAIPGPSFSVNTFLTERINETFAGYTAPVVVNIFGNDLDVLDREAHEVAGVLRKVPGAADVLVQAPSGMPQLTVRLRKRALERWGFDPVGVLDAIRTAYGGDTVGQTYDGNRVFPVTVILAPRDRASPAQVGALPLRAPDGAYVRLGRIADIYESDGRYQVLHQGARRVQAVTANVVGRNVAGFVKEAKARIAAAIPLPAGTYLEFAGAAQAQARSTRELLVNSLVALVGIVLLLSIVTQCAANLLLVLANLPFAFVGGVLAGLATGGALSLGSMVGFVALFGITLRNSILMIAHYQHLVVAEGARWNLETAIRGAADRLAPILMTSLVTGLGVLPLALGMHAPGREIEGPMAVVILGGLVTSTVLNLLVLPTLALRYGRFAPRGLD